MKAAGYLSQGFAEIKPYQVAQDFDSIGILALIGTEAEAGVDLSTTTDAVDVVGLTFDVATYGTPQLADGSDPERAISGNNITSVTTIAIQTMKGSTPTYTSTMVPTCSWSPSASDISAWTSRRTP